MSAHDGETVSRAAETSPAYLEVLIRGRDELERIPVAAGIAPREELTRFLNRQGPYAQLWIRLGSDAYVRYDAIESVSVSVAGG